MRINIKDIINAVGCDEARAAQIEQGIDEQNLLDWSECEMSELNKAARYVDENLSDEIK